MGDVSACPTVWYVTTYDAQVRCIHMPIADVGSVHRRCKSFETAAPPRCRISQCCHACPSYPATIPCSIPCYLVVPSHSGPTVKEATTLHGRADKFVGRLKSVTVTNCNCSNSPTLSVVFCTLFHPPCLPCPPAQRTQPSSTPLPEKLLRS